MYPENLRYSSEHEWVQEIDGNVVRIGITDYAVSSLGDIVYVSMAQVGEEVARDDAAGQIDSPKASADVYAPVSGIVVAVNEALEDSPELVNEDCYGKGWLLEIEMSNPEDLSHLMDAEGYKSLVES